MAKLVAPDKVRCHSELSRGISLLNYMNEERKTLEQRAQMTDIERLRHSAANVLATAILCHSERSEAKPRNLLLS